MHFPLGKLNNIVAIDELTLLLARDGARRLDREHTAYKNKTFDN